MVAQIYEKHHLLELVGGSLSVYESGQADLPPVILLHGAMYDEARLIWYHLAPFLAQTRRVFAVDFPRHGQSRPWTGFVGRDCLDEVVDEVIHYFNLPPLPLIGLSMGGGVSISYALKHPEQVTGMVLMGPGGLGDHVMGQFFTWAYIQIPGSLTALAKFYARMSIKMMRRSWVSLLHEGQKTPNFDDFVALSMEEAKLKGQYHEKALDDWQIAGMGPFKLKINFLPELHRLTCPTLWLRGQNDPLVVQKDMEEAVRLTPGAELKVIENAGHLQTLEQPGAVNQAVVDFLGEKHL